jgi:hypothetical protein
MWGDKAWGEAGYGEPQDNTISPFQSRNGVAVITFTAEGAGTGIPPSVGEVEFGFTADGAGALSRQKVRVIQTAPQTRRGKTGLSHTGLN